MCRVGVAEIGPTLIVAVLKIVENVGQSVMIEGVIDGIYINPALLPTLQVVHHQILHQQTVLLGIRGVEESVQYGSFIFGHF